MKNYSTLSCGLSITFWHHLKGFRRGPTRGLLLARWIRWSFCKTLHRHSLWNEIVSILRATPFFLTSVICRRRCHRREPSVLRHDLCHRRLQLRESCFECLRRFDWRRRWWWRWRGETWGGRSPSVTCKCLGKWTTVLSKVYFPKIFKFYITEMSKKSKDRLRNSAL